MTRRVDECNCGGTAADLGPIPNPVLKAHKRKRMVSKIKQLREEMYQCFQNTEPVEEIPDEVREIVLDFANKVSSGEMTEDEVRPAIFDEATKRAEKSGESVSNYKVRLLELFRYLLADSHEQNLGPGVAYKMPYQTEGYEVDDDGILTKVPMDENLVIPPSIRGIKVVSIAEGLCKDRDDIETVLLPPSLKFIGCEAFMNCEALSEIDFPEGIEDLGESAFSGCNSLTTVRIPRSVKFVGMSLFGNCESLSEAYVPDTLSLVGKGVFVGCSSLKRDGIIKFSAMFEWNKKLKRFLGEAETLLGYKQVGPNYGDTKKLTKADMEHSFVEDEDEEKPEKVTSGLKGVQKVDPSLSDYGEEELFSESVVPSSLVKKVAKEVSSIAKDEDPNIDPDEDAMGKCFDAAVKSGKKGKDALELAQKACKELKKNR